MSEWQSIESAPKDGTLVLVSNGRDVAVGAYAVHRYYEYEDEPGAPGLFRKVLREEYALWDADGICGITHWMPLPPPPEGA
jgi:hypothetical protein